MEEKCKVACLDTLLQGADQEAGKRIPVFGVAAADALKNDLEALLVVVVCKGLVTFQ